VRPDGRPQSVQAFRQALGIDDLPAGAVAMPTLPAPARQAAGGAALSAAPTAPARPLPMPQAGGMSRTTVMAAAAAAVVVLAAAAFWAGQRQQAPALATSQVPATPPATAPAVAALPAAAAPPAAASFSIQSEFDRVMQARSAEFDVKATPNASRLRIGKDRLGFKVTSSRDGHVYVLVGGPDGSLLLLYPNAVAGDSRIRAGQTLALPQSSWPLDTAEPAGPERFAVIVSEHPRDFSHLSQERVAWFLNLPTGAAGAALASGHAGPGSVLAGKADCSTTGCDRYGAALFSVDVVN